MTATGKTREEEFIERIGGLDTGELAMLRRGCGERDPVDGRCPWLLGLIYGVASEASAFLVASLLAQYKTTDIRVGRHCIEGNFGVTWRRAIAMQDSKSLQQRFSVLLDADYDPRTGDGDLPYRLRQLVRYAASRDVGVDWPALLKHLRGWQSTTKWVQKEWARSFFDHERPEEATITVEEKE